ncbi:hypothetical protein [Aurantimonas sp. VKM B-3413]|uniref:hypothetical protein n=1 Tax=Aurantimonas sp. VKM B-3413 TaxID=2779401 RepID=UPI001E380A75|nr:hypothetical protein [Aurantimonas sp. VKM B-3413]MCB8837968.1 hypothetical protein [Aurantimonas sp. VKM B-3413]
MSDSMREFASSSNGDRWFLCRDEATSEDYVLHQGNPPSGGAATRIAIGDFLKARPAGPEHQALNQLIGSLAVTVMADDRAPY